MPTIDLKKLYAGKGEPGVVEDFDRIQKLLSDRQECIQYLRIFNVALAKELLSRSISPLASPIQLASIANEVLDKVLRSYEQACGISGKLAVLVGFASADDFRTLTTGGQHFQDVGAGATHGEFTHRIQWFIAMGAITGGRFDGQARPPYQNAPAALYAKSIDDAYAVDIDMGITKKAYMWDWVFDRIRGVVPRGEPLADLDYDPRRDAWTHPGEPNEPGGLSNDILSGRYRTTTLKNLRQAQVDTHQANKDSMNYWFNVIKELRLAKGQDPSPDAAPTYFEHELLPDSTTMKELISIKAPLRQSLGEIEVWATSAAAAPAEPAAPWSIRNPWPDAVPKVRLTEIDFSTLEGIARDSIGHLTAWLTYLQSSGRAGGPDSSFATALVSSWRSSLIKTLAPVITAIKSLRQDGDTISREKLHEQIKVLREGSAQIQGTAGWRSIP
jgi:hypothetical protein